MLGKWVAVNLDWHYTADAPIIQGMPTVWDGAIIIMKRVDFASIINELIEYKNNN